MTPEEAEAAKAARRAYTLITSTSRVGEVELRPPAKRFKCRVMRGGNWLDGGEFYGPTHADAQSTAEAWARAYAAKKREPFEYGE